MPELKITAMDMHFLAAKFGKRPYFGTLQGGLSILTNAYCPN